MNSFPQGAATGTLHSAFNGILLKLNNGDEVKLIQETQWTKDDSGSWIRGVIITWLVVGPWTTAVLEIIPGDQPGYGELGSPECPYSEMAAGYMEAAVSGNDVLEIDEETKANIMKLSAVGHVTGRLAWIDEKFNIFESTKARLMLRGDHQIKVARRYSGAPVNRTGASRDWKIKHTCGYIKEASTYLQQFTGKRFVYLAVPANVDKVYFHFTADK